MPGASFLLPRPKVRWKDRGSHGQPVAERQVSVPYSIAQPPSLPDRFVTPDQKYSMDNTPHTPTPFKNALEKYGPLKPLVCGAARQVCMVGSLRST